MVLITQQISLLSQIVILDAHNDKQTATFSVVLFHAAIKQQILCEL